jgi:hypothetical protein
MMSVEKISEMNSARYKMAQRRTGANCENRELRRKANRMCKKKKTGRMIKQKK